MLAANAACRGCHSCFARHPHAAPAAARRAARRSRHRPAALRHAGGLLDAHDNRGDDVDDCRRRGSSVGSPEACGSSIESAESNGLARAVCDEPRSRICAAIKTGLTSAPDGSDLRLRPAAAVCAVRAQGEPAVGMARLGHGLGVLGAAHLIPAIMVLTGPSENIVSRAAKS